MRRLLPFLLAAGLAAVPAAAAAAPPAGRLIEVTATVETPALLDDDAGGNADADDPAIWVTAGTAAAAGCSRPSRTAGCGSTT